MKILMINSVCGIRSTGRICTDLAVELEKQGHIVKIAYGRENVPEQFKKYAVRIGNEIDVRLHAIKARMFDCSGFCSKSATRKFIKWMQEYDPDVIHLHNLHGYYINIEMLFRYLKSSNKKIVWTLHDCWPFTGHCAHFDFIGCNRWKDGCGNCKQKTEYPSSYFMDSSNKNWEKKKKIFSDIKNLTVVVPSKWLRGLVEESFLKSYPIKVINNGIDLNIFKPTVSDFKRNKSIEDKKVVLGVASTWSKKKGIDDFFKLRNRLDLNYVIVLVGISKDEIKNAPNGVLLISKTNDTKELAEIYSASDYFVNMTYEDNYPTTNLEAQACGTPCITYRTGGSIESVPNQNVVDKGDILDVVNLLQKQLSLNTSISDRNDMLRKYIELYYKQKN
ncbi:glycosyl transferase [Anaeromassilibacillus sp. An172]|uniref:glycosyltransferase n=1 Tax=Anaeromassilibacillus sp. An172 TaxID=1965570 RepID=UPI000B3AA7DA|nr:glycosyltransferase [Anaeromassilibacillus sp. An172]OUP75312.1 glycosyl transferase [Anaeromassilibacillus sp. An172]